MARPSVQHNGFLIPNAQDVSNPLLAEPDRIDFNTDRCSRWGIISGCAIGEQGALTVSVGSGVALINGIMVPVAGGGITNTAGRGGGRPVRPPRDGHGRSRTGGRGGVRAFGYTGTPRRPRGRRGGGRGLRMLGCSSTPGHSSAGPVPGSGAPTPCR